MAMMAILSTHCHEIATDMLSAALPSCLFDCINKRAIANMTDILI